MNLPALAALPFFLPVGDGERFCLFHQPQQTDPADRARGAVLYVHPFAEELNQSRRMAALQSRAFARAGYGVLQIDLHGCGDSGGEFADTRWHDWRSDLAAAAHWLRQNCEGPLLLWGLRLGALLALDAVAQRLLAPDAMLLWQPVISGQAHLQQFLRLQSATRLFASMPPPDHGNDEAAGVVEVAGYALAPALTDAMRAADASTLAPPCTVYWLESVAGADGMTKPALQPASQLLIDRWRDNGSASSVTSAAVVGQPFWASAEINACPALLAATATLTDGWADQIRIAAPLPLRAVAG